MLPATLGALVRKVALGWGAERIEQELEAQVQKILTAGVKVSHLDAHKHTHLLPPVLTAMVSVARRHRIAWIRRPFDVPLTAASQTASATRKLSQQLLRPLNLHFERTLGRARLRATDYFAGFQLTGSFGERELAELIRALPAGLGEFMAHPGRCTDELRATSSRLKESREVELRALTSKEVREAVAEAGVELVDFRMAASTAYG
jgi:predicted glycoside hydrolase/deacetylase ChbG (UPF0249 family)